MSRPPRLIKISNRNRNQYAILRAEVESTSTNCFGPNGNLTGMRERFGWANKYPVKIGAYVHAVDYHLYNEIVRYNSLMTP